MAKQKQKPIFVKPRDSDGCVMVQLQSKKRNAEGLLKFHQSKSLTVYNLTLDQVEARLRAALVR